MKIKCLMIVAVFAVLLGCSDVSELYILDAIQESKPNYIMNGDFEKYEEVVDNSYPGWIFDKSKIDQVTIDTLRSMTGEMSLKILQPKQEMQIISDAFEVYHRNAYGIKLSAKSLLKKVPININFITFNESGKIMSKYTSTVIITTNWDTFYFKCDFLKSRSSYARVFLTIPKNDSVVLLDDISCMNIIKYQKK